jgi:hypothetical protein
MLTGALVAAACSGSEPTTTTTTPQTTTTAPTTTTSSTTTTTQPTTTTLSEEELEAIQLEEDTILIRTMFRGRSDSWALGPDSAIEFIVDHNYPGMECTAADFEDFFPEFQLESFFEEIIVHVDTIEPDPEWILPDIGSVPSGRLYIFQITYTYDLGSSLLEVHATIIDEDAYFFIQCREP